MSILQFYEHVVLRRPVVTLAIGLLITAMFGWYAQDFGLDASADSLVLERDQDLDYYRTIGARYGTDDYLIVTFTPQDELFSTGMLRKLGNLRNELKALTGVESVVSILDVPLVKSPPVKLRNFANGVRHLEEAGTDSRLARAELTSSPLFRELLISPDGRTTALRVNLRNDPEYVRLRQQRDGLREKKFYSVLTDEEALSLADVTSKFEDYSQSTLAMERDNIAAVRAVLDRYQPVASLHLGGVPMIVVDSIEFIRHDLVVFGIAVLGFLILILAIAFRQPRWPTLSLLSCLATCVVMVGILGMTHWRVTLVSSNFLSLLLILVLALNLHIIVRYREIHALQPKANQLTLVRETVRRIIVPCFYTALTTMVAFGSLIVSGIRPVVDFGWLMVIGIGIGFVFSFTLFPAGLLLLKPGQPASRRDLTAAITAFFARLIQRYSKQTLIGFAVLVVVGVAGMTRLTVENRFIDYYKKSTEIYQGMELIDRVLGGTTPLDVIIDAPPPLIEEIEFPEVDMEGEFEEEEFEDIYADDPEEEAGITASSYWFNYPQIENVTAIHDYLDGLPETGKVVSIATAARILAELDEDLIGDNLYLSIVYNRMPEAVKQALFAPYLSTDGDQIRFSIRVFESDKSLRRGELMAKIRRDLIAEHGLAEEQIHLTGMLVLYNNMLQSLYRSQILTLGAVFLAIMLMFLVLFRSGLLAVTAIIPNVVSAIVVLGLMGWLAIPLDLMTITIAAITVGIAVDDTIHYVHRFNHEFSKDGDYWAAIHRCHLTIGRAMYYTSVTIMLGFSILALSQFIPTLYFGLLTGLAMLVALLANMTLLPVLIVAFKAGRGRDKKPPPPVERKQ